MATDRLSAFDVVMATPIPDKGRVLTQLSLFWFNLLRDVIPNHVLSSDTLILPRPRGFYGGGPKISLIPFFCASALKTFEKTVSHYRDKFHEGFVRCGAPSEER